MKIDSFIHLNEVRYIIYVIATLPLTLLFYKHLQFARAIFPYLLPLKNIQLLGFISHHIEQKNLK